MLALGPISGGDVTKAEPGCFESTGRGEIHDANTVNGNVMQIAWQQRRTAAGLASSRATKLGDAGLQRVSQVNRRASSSKIPPAAKLLSTATRQRVASWRGVTEDHLTQYNRVEIAPHATSVPRASKFADLHGDALGQRVDECHDRSVVAVSDAIGWRVMVEQPVRSKEP